MVIYKIVDGLIDKYACV